MNATETETLQQFAWDGPAGVTTMVAVAAVLLVLFAWALYRERRILGWRTSIGFGLLRAIAIVTVLWMLLAPIRLTVQTSSTRQAVAIVTDVSGSMAVVDPLGTADEVRWMVAADESANPTSTASSDRAVAATGIAQREVQLAIAALTNHLGDTAVTRHVSRAQMAINRAQESIEAIQPLGRSVELDNPHGDLVDEHLHTARQMFRSAELDSFAQLATLLTKGKTPPQTGWRESLPDLQARLGRLRRVLLELSASLSQAEAAPQILEPSDAALAISQTPRLQRVRQFLTQLQNSALDPIADQVDVQWSRFDESLQSLPDHDTLQRQLKRTTDSDTDAAAATNLSAVLEHLRRLQQQQPIAAAFVLSDVAHNETGQRDTPQDDSTDLVAAAKTTTHRQPLEVAATLDQTPVYLVPIGNPTRLRDLELVSVDAPQVAMRNDKIVIEAHLEAHRASGQRCVVQLIENTEVVDFREIAIESDFVSRTVRFERQVPQVGEQTFQVAIEPIDGEITDQNNRDFVDVNVTRNDIKVLLADELPRWEYRYLTQLFRRDAKIDCDELLFRPRVIATGHRQQSESLPTTIDQWDRYDVVILGDLGPDRMDAKSQTSLIQYLRQRGGTLITIAGSQSMPQAYVDQPLSQIIPVDPVDGSADSLATDAGYAFHVTDEGRSHVALMIGETQQATRAAWEFVNQFAPLHVLSPWRVPKPAAKNLIAAVPRQSTADATFDTSHTFLCWQPMGRGRVVYLAAPDTYRLRFLRGDQLHYRFWGQLLRWAIASDMTSGSQFVRVRMAKTRYKIDETVRGEVELLDDQGQPLRDATGIALSLTSADYQRTVPLAADPQRPGVYYAEFTATQPGIYSATPVGDLIDTLNAADSDPAAAAAFTVQAELPRELIDTRSNRVLASQIADLTGGQVLPPTAVAEILALSDLEPIVTQTVQRQPLWAQWKYLWLVFGCLQLEWIVRRWRGLS